MPPSTEPTAAQTHAGRWAAGDVWPFDRIADKDLAAMLEIPKQEVAARRSALERSWSSPTAIEEVLARLSPATLAVLMMLAEAGGSMSLEEVEEEAYERFAMAAGAVMAAANAAIQRALIVPLATAYGERILSLVAPAAGLIAPRVLDLDLPELPAAPFLPRESSEPRLLLGAATMLAHADIKGTQEDRPNRGQLKRLAAQVGIDVDLLDRLLIAAIDVGLVDSQGEYLRPRREALEQAAAGRYPAEPLLAAITEQIARGPIAFEMVRRLAGRRPFEPGPPWRFDPAEPAWLALLPGIAVGSAGGVAGVAAADVGGNPAGHVTPSFEVYLPPESPARDLVRVGAFAEVSRLDRVITFRVTRASVGRAAAAGLSDAEIIATLVAVGRHPVPQNVEVAIRDWAGDSQHATTELGRVVVVAPAASDRVEAVLQPLAARRLAPGVFLMAPTTQPRQVALALAKAGVHVRAPAAPAAAGPMAAPAADAAAGGPSSGPTTGPQLGTPPPALRARFAAWQEAQRSRPAADLGGPEDDDFRAAMGDCMAALDRWSAAMGHRWSDEDPRKPALGLALSIAGPDAMPRLLEATTIAQLCRNALAAAEPRMAAPSMRPAWQILRRALTEDGPSAASNRTSAVSNRTSAASNSSRAVSNGSSAASNSSRAASTSQPRVSAAAPGSILAALVGARDDGAPIQLQLRNGRQTTLRVLDVTQRGTMWMALGEDLVTNSSVALRIGEIASVIATKGEPDREREPSTPAGGTPAGERARWIPGPGDHIPAGHAPCPCQSGERYRNCCRRLS